MKPGLTAKMRKKRLGFAIQYQTFDFQRIIWRDETSVVLDSRRSGVRV